MESKSRFVGVSGLLHWDPSLDAESIQPNIEVRRTGSCSSEAKDCIFIYSAKPASFGYGLGCFFQGCISCSS